MPGHDIIIVNCILKVISNVMIIFLGGDAYTLCRQNSSNCWHLFTVDNCIDGSQTPDQTLEISL